MSKIVLDSVVSGYDLSKINANFQKIQTELNEKVLYRNPPTGEPNTLEKDIDANGFSILNLGSISIEGYEDITAMVEQTTDARDQALEALEIVLATEDRFTDLYLGNKTSDPLVDNDGNALVEGCFYFNTTLSPKRLRVYNGVDWQDVASAVINIVEAIDASLYASQAEAEAGLNSVKVMTPLTTKQSIEESKTDWVYPDQLPTQIGNTGKFLSTNGTEPVWQNPIPDTFSVTAIQLGESGTASQNFVWSTNNDGTCKLARGVIGSTTQDILTIDAAGKVVLAGGSNELGVGQTWQDVKTTPGRVVNTTYTNSTGKPIEVMITYSSGVNVDILVGPTGSTIAIATTNGASTTDIISFTVPAGHEYKWNSASGTILKWVELRG